MWFTAVESGWKVITLAIDVCLPHPKFLNTHSSTILQSDLSNSTIHRLELGHGYTWCLSTCNAIVRWIPSIHMHLLIHHLSNFVSDFIWRMVTTLVFQSNSVRKYLLKDNPNLTTQLWVIYKVLTTMYSTYCKHTSEIQAKAHQQ